MEEAWHVKGESGFRNVIVAVCFKSTYYSVAWVFLSNSKWLTFMRPSFGKLSKLPLNLE